MHKVGVAIVSANRVNCFNMLLIGNARLRIWGSDIETSKLEEASSGEIGHIYHFMFAVHE
jgi:hypothetical protein